MRRDLMLAVAPELLRRRSQGSTDSEVLFHLALTFGLEDDPVARARAGDRARRGDRAPRTGSTNAVQASIGVSDGESLWAVRYSTEGDVADAVRLGGGRRGPPPAPREPAPAACRDEDRIIVSEPLVDLPGAWHEIPESTAATVPRGGEVALRAFRPADATAGEAAALTPSG